MKKILSIFVIILLLANSFIISAEEKYVLSELDNKNISRIYEKLRINSKSDKYKNELNKSLDSILLKLEIGSKNYEIILALKKKIENIQENNNSIIEEERSETETNNNKQDENIKDDESKNNTETNTEDNKELKNFRVNMSKVQETWVGRQNEVRIPMGLSNYTHLEKLESSATNWSDILISRGKGDFTAVHKRDLSDSYYNYPKIASWMKDRGVVCKNINRYTFSESVAWTGYSCAEDAQDCTYEFIDSLRKSFDKYMQERERNEDSRPHYNSIISPVFKLQGVGVSIKQISPTKFEAFITTHYCTELE